MFDMGFDPYALVKPKTKEDVAALLKEAVLVKEQMHEVLDKIIEIRQQGERRQ